MSVPEEVRKELRKRVWSQADRIGWLHLSPSLKSRQYDNWSRDTQVGGVIEQYVDRRHVRTYIKDSLLREYAREFHSSSERPFRVLRISPSIGIAESYEKPHGRRLADGRVIAWGRATDWKSILLAIHERAYEREGSVPYGAVFLDATGRYAELRIREMVEDAAKRLNIKVCWLEM